MMAIMGSGESMRSKYYTGGTSTYPRGTRKKSSIGTGFNQDLGSKKRKKKKSSGVPLVKRRRG